MAIPVKFYRFSKKKIQQNVRATQIKHILVRSSQNPGL